MFFVESVNIKKEFAGQNLAYQMYTALILEYGLVIQSGVNHTPFSKRLYEKLLKNPSIDAKLYDSRTEELTDIDQNNNPYKDGTYTSIILKKSNL